jgi:hypothetical protein
MKLRCITNSIRFRLRKSDVQEFVEKKYISDSLLFPNGTSFEYGLKLTDNKSEATCSDNKIVIYVDKIKVEKWVNSEDVSLKLAMSTPKNTSLSILIEKDFPCKHTGDDFNDTYHELQPKEHRMYRKETILND